MSAGMPSSSPIRQCRSCGMDIRWVTMHTGKRMPVEATPCVVDTRDTGPGSVVVTVLGDDLTGRVKRGRKVEKQESTITPDSEEASHYVAGYESHFAYCKQAATWRKDKSGG